MSVDIEQQKVGQETAKTVAQCVACGWWDMSMKYGQSKECTRCGVPLPVSAAENTAS
jgi:uncharacterized paraquat-inducible protein A